MEGPPRFTRARGVLRTVHAWAAECFHTFVFAALPLLVMAGSSAGVLPLDAAALMRSLAAVVAVTAVLIVMLTPLIPALSRRAACLSFVFIGFDLYAFVVGTSTAPVPAAVYTVVSFGVAAFIVRPWVQRPRSSTPLNLAACTLLAVNLVHSVPAALAEEPWRPVADALVDEVLASQGSPHAIHPRRDMYYVVLDGFGRPDVLRELYDVDMGPLVRALRSRGFSLPESSRSNYAQTFLSLGSSLNLSYLDPLARSMGDSRDRRALHYLIQNNALMRLAKRAGYHVIAIGSNYTATRQLDGADRCFCEEYGFDEIEVAAINLTPFRALPLHRWTYQAHRQKVHAAFAHLAEVAREPGPKLVLAHVLSPHPPFVFTSEGRPRALDGGMFSFVDGSHYRGPRAEYVAGYRDQAQFVARRLLLFVDTVLKQPGPAPVIVLHGDHGPGLMWDWNDLARGNMRERLAIFSAYHFPGSGSPALPHAASPVTALRRMANVYFGTHLPVLPEASFASTWRRPYEFVRVDAGDRDDKIRIAADDSVTRR